MFTEYCAKYLLISKAFQHALFLDKDPRPKVILSASILYSLDGIE